MGVHTLTLGTTTIRVVIQLNRRAGDRSIGAEHAAVSGLRTEQCSAALAFVEELAGVGGHRLDLRRATRRAGEGRLKDDRHIGGSYQKVRARSAIADMAATTPDQPKIERPRVGPAAHAPHALARQCRHATYPAPARQTTAK